MNTYTFSFDMTGEQITTSTFQARNKKEAKAFAQLYKRRELKQNYPFIKLNRVKIS